MFVAFALFDIVGAPHNLLLPHWGVILAINQLRKSIIGPQFQVEILSIVDAIVNIQQRMDAVSRNLQFDFKFGFGHRKQLEASKRPNFSHANYHGKFVGMELTH